MDVSPISASTVLEMGPLDWVMTGLGVLLFAYADIGAPKLWRGESPTLRRREPPRWWLWGGALWRGLCRGTPAIPVLGLNPAIACLILGGLMPSDSGATWIVYALAYIASFFLVVVWSVITLFARPKFLIPPHLRDQRGALSEWWDGLRRRAGRTARGARG